MTFGTLLRCDGSHSAAYPIDTGGWWMWWLTLDTDCGDGTAGQTSLGLLFCKSLVVTDSLTWYISDAWCNHTGGYYSTVADNTVINLCVTNYKKFKI